MNKFALIIVIVFAQAFSAVVHVANNPQTMLRYRVISGDINTSQTNVQLTLTNFTAETFLIANDGAGDFSIRFIAATEAAFTIKSGEVFNGNVSFDKLFILCTSLN